MRVGGRRGGWRKSVRRTLVLCGTRRKWDACLKRLLQRTRGSFEHSHKHRTSPLRSMSMGSRSGGRWGCWNSSIQVDASSHPPPQPSTAPPPPVLVPKRIRMVEIRCPRRQLPNLARRLGVVSLRVLVPAPFSFDPRNVPRKSRGEIGTSIGIISNKGSRYRSDGDDIDGLECPLFVNRASTNQAITSAEKRLQFAPTEVFASPDGREKGTSKCRWAGLKTRTEDGNDEGGHGSRARSTHGRWKVRTLRAGTGTQDA